jgi:hypothetical protein
VQHNRLVDNGRTLQLDIHYPFAAHGRTKTTEMGPASLIAIREAGPTRISDTEWNDSISPILSWRRPYSLPGVAGEAGAAVASQAAPVIYMGANVVFLPSLLACRSSPSCPRSAGEAGHGVAWSTVPAITRLRRR